MAQTHGSAPYRKAFQTNSTASSYATNNPGTTEPSGDGVFKTAAFDTLSFIPFGAGSDNNTCSVRIIGYRKVVNPATPATSDVWVASNICEVAATLSAAVGVAGGHIIATDRLADTMTKTDGSVLILATGGDVPCEAVVDVSSYDYAKVVTATGGSATNANALVAIY